MIYLYLFIILVLVYYKFNVINHIVILYSVWFLILLFSFFELSELHIKIDDYTYFVIALFLLTYLIGSFFYKLKLKLMKNSSIKEIPSVQYIISYKSYIYFYLLFIFLSILNVIIAGYVPLISMILTGDSGYGTFGISGLYGFYLAYSTAMGLLSYYLYLVTSSRKYLYMYLIVFFVMILFITRQNIIVLLVEPFVLYGLVKNKINNFKVILSIIGVLFLFSLIGEMRSGDIKEIIKAKDEYQSLPSFVFWLYGYNYFSALNLNNIFLNTINPYFDGSSFSSLIPNFIKNIIGLNFEHEYFLHNPNFNVSTALATLYLDIGLYGLIIIGLIFGYYTAKYYSLSKIQNNFNTIGIYSVLYFCTLFSFFTNYWFYLPIIFQIFFIYIFSKFIFKRRSLSYV